MAYIGIDFGTNSVRGLIWDTRSRNTLRLARDVQYETFDKADGSSLFLAPQVWVSAGESILQELSEYARSTNVLVDGIGVAFTSCTIIPIKSDGEPVASDYTVNDAGKRPHLFAKMWRHHTQHVQKCADDLVRGVSFIFLQRRNVHLTSERFLARFGMKKSPGSR